jgi:hypothetical protein
VFLRWKYYQTYSCELQGIFSLPFFLLLIGAIEICLINSQCRAKEASSEKYVT